MKALSFGGHIEPSPEIRPLYNIGCLFDIQAGRWMLGKHGESIMNGGLARFTGIGGIANTYKSTIAHFMMLKVLNNYASSTGLAYDTEVSMSRERMTDLSRHMDRIRNEDLFSDGTLTVTDSTKYFGDVWFEEVKKYADHKASLPKKDLMGTTPFVTKKGVAYDSPHPSVVEIDSLSRMPVTAVEEIFDKNLVGASGANMEAITSNKAKQQMLVQLPILTEMTSIPFIATAHVDDNISLDPYSPPAKKLAFMSQKLKFKYVPNQFLFLPNNLWFCYSATKYSNKTTKGSEFPLDPKDSPDISCDLMKITAQNLRGKYGLTGVPYEIIVSQTEGVLEHLTEFCYCKYTANDYGISGNKQNYVMTFAPHHKLQRTTVRSKLNEHADLRRAVTLSSELAQIMALYTTMPQELRCTAEELYQDLIDMGYDWSVLLKTRSYWTFEQDKNPIPFLSSMDLLRMRVGLYVPYWYKTVTGVTIDPNKAKVKIEDIDVEEIV